MPSTSVLSQPPTPLPAQPEPPEGERVRYGEAFGLPGDCSRYLQYLPPIYAADPFLGRFLLAFEGVLAPIEQTVDHFDLYLSPRTAPAYFLEHLARWLGIDLDEKWPSATRRALLAEAIELYRRRGTRWALSRHIEICTGVAPEIVEPEEQPFHFRVILRVPAGQAVDRAAVERIIQADKPAHTTYELQTVESR
jgi:phage tail-like protein